MPSKTRYILQTPIETFRGAQVVAMLCKVAKGNLFNLKLPDGWASFSTPRKLEFLVQFLPVEYRLMIFREPKWTRKKRSHYHKSLSAIHSKPKPSNPNIQDFPIQQGVQYVVNPGGLLPNAPNGF